MHNVLLETTKIKNLKSGLGQFCLHLGRAIQLKNTQFGLTYYLARQCREIFGSAVGYADEKKWHQVFGLPGKPDILHWFYQGSHYWPKNKNAKVVLTVHDLNFTVKYSGWKRKLKMDQLQRQADRADRIVAISNYTRNEILRHLEVDGKKISVIYNGVDAGPHHAVKPAFIPGQKFFFTIGIIAQKKNFHVLLPLLQAFDDRVLVIAGHRGGAYAEQIVARAKSLGVADRVILPGEVSEEEKAWLYQNCEAFLFPSLAEGFGLPVIEAMSCGKPAFISSLTSLPEVGGPHAFYFRDFQPEHMVEVVRSGLKEYAERPDMATAIKAWTSRFSWEAAASQYLEIYQSLVTH